MPDRTIKQEDSSMAKGLIVGAGSGVGAEFHKQVQDDPRFEGVDWFHPPQDYLDVRDGEHVKAYMELYGPFDYIVYTAGVNRLKWVAEVETRDLQDTFSVNLFGFILVCGAQAEAFPGHETRAITVVSDSSHTPMRGSIAYCSSKAALVMAIKCLARELAPTWSVNGISPGIIEDTPMTDYIDSTVPGFRGWDPDKAREYEKSMIPMGRRATKEEVSHLLMDALKAPAYMSGNITELTGGK